MLSKTKINFLYNFLHAISQVLFPIILFPYVARVLTPEGLGIFSFVESVNKYFVLFAALGIPIYGIRQISKVKKCKESQGRVFSELLTVHILFSAIVIIIYLFLVYSIDKLYVYRPFFWLGISTILANIFSVEWYFQGVEDFKFITIINIFLRLLSILLIFIFVNSPEDLYNYFYILFLTPILSSVINFGYAFQRLKISFDFNFVELFKTHLKPLFYIFISLSLITIYTLLDNVILGFLTDNRSVGIYSTALKFAKIPIVFIGVLSTVMLPKLTNLVSNGDDLEFRKVINKSISMVYFISIPILFTLIGLSHNIIFAFVGRDYVDSIILMRFFSVSTLLIGLSNLFGFQILTSLSKDKYFTLSVGIGTISSLTINILTIPYFNIYGALFANLFSEVLVTFVTYRLAKRFVDIKLNLIYFLKLFAICSPIIPLIFVLNIFVMNDFLVIILSFITIAIYYSLINFFFLKDELIVDLYTKSKKYIYERL